VWLGYEPAVQASELERYLPKLIAAVSNGVAQQSVRAIA
jgi:hypothetical protein